MGKRHVQRQKVQPRHTEYVLCLPPHVSLLFDNLPIHCCGLIIQYGFVDTGPVLLSHHYFFAYCHVLTKTSTDLIAET